MKKLKFLNTEKVFYIADTHFGHANIIKHCNRPFSNVEEMDKKLIENWNNVVKPDDVVIVVGDFAFKGSPAREYLHKLNGKKHLIIGNHDKVNPPDWESISDIATIVHQNKWIVCCHYPMAEWNGFYHDALHFFGHIHNADNDAQRIMSNIKGAYNVGADLQNFTPMTADEIIKLKLITN